MPAVPTPCSSLNAYTCASILRDATGVCPLRSDFQTLGPWDAYPASLEPTEDVQEMQNEGRKESRLPNGSWDPESKV